MFVCLNGPDSCLICPVFDIGCICFKRSRYEQAFSADFFHIFCCDFWGRHLEFGLDLNMYSVFNRAESVLTVYDHISLILTGNVQYIHMIL